MRRIETSEYVSSGHPDKVADKISDSLLEFYLSKDKKSRVALETLVTTNRVIVAGEVSCKETINKEDIISNIRKTITDLGYDRDMLGFNGNCCPIDLYIHEQSPDISRGVDNEYSEEIGAGDQGIMFGYACDETPNFMPLPLEISKSIIKFYEDVRPSLTGFEPDAKAEVSVSYDKKGPIHIDTIIMSVQHDDDVNIEHVRMIIQSMIDEVLTTDPNYAFMYDDDTKFLINPTGRFVIGGPAGDTGVTGRKIIVDTYGGRAPHGGGAFSGKDPSKVDRSGAYMARYVAKNIVASGIAKECLVSISYCIGVSRPVSIFVKTFGTGICDDEIISRFVFNKFDFRPSSIIKRLKLDEVKYSLAANNEIGCEEYGFLWENTEDFNDLKNEFLIWKKNH